MQFDRLGIRVIRIAARLQDFAEDAFLAHLGEDLSGRQIFAREGDANTDFVAGHDELGADFPRPKVGIVKVAAFGQDAVISSAGLHALIVGSAIFRRRRQFHVGFEIPPLFPDEHGLLAGSHVDLAGVIHAYDQS
jgi:hypothetical protein